jgi:hypothetical protein
MLHISRPHDYRNRECKAEPELVAEHRHRMSCMAVVAPVGGLHLVISVRVGSMFGLGIHR